MSIVSFMNAYNTLDTTVGTNSYTPGGGNSASIADDEGYQIKGTGCGEFRIDSDTNLIHTYGKADGTTDSFVQGVFFFNCSAAQAITSLNAQGRTTGNVDYANSAFTAAQIPVTGGYFPIWFNLSGGFDGNIEAIGVRISCGDTGSGNVPNTYVDNILSTTSNDKVRAIGSETISSVLAFETDATTGFNGVMLPLRGVPSLYAQLGFLAQAGAPITEANSQVIMVDSGYSSIVESPKMVWTSSSASSGFITLTNVFISNTTPSTPDRVHASVLQFEQPVSASAGTITITDCTFLGQNQIFLDGSGVTLTGGSMRTRELNLNSNPNLSNVTITTESLSAESTVFQLSSQSAEFAANSGLNNISFIYGNGGHAITLRQTGTYVFTEIEFSGYGADGTDSAAIFNDSGGAITINVDGGDSANYTVKNGTNASTTIQDPDRVFELKGLKDGTEVRLVEEATNSSIAGVETVSGGVGTGISNGSRPGVGVSVSGAAGANIFNYRYQYSSDTDIFAAIISGSTFEIIYQDFTLGDADTSQEIQQQTDRNYDNPPG